MCTCLITRSVDEELWSGVDGVFSLAGSLWRKGITPASDVMSSVPEIPALILTLVAIAKISMC